MPRGLSLLIGVLLLAAASQVSPGSAQYSCSCEGVVEECLCPSASPPGGLSPADMPQFIVVTNDDAVTSQSEPIIRGITSDVHRNPNGCPIPATWYVSIEYTEADLVSRLYEDGHEIATHTISHGRTPSAREVGGARDWLVNEAGIPIHDVQGFRSPFLLHSEEVRSYLHRFGFRYDSSITEQAGSTSPTSASEQQRVFPYTLQDGVAQDCSVGTGTCSADERLPGLWEVPMWLLEDEAGAPITAMDIPSTQDAYQVLKRELDRRLAGNHAPLGVFVHAGQVALGDTRERLSAFFAYALQQPNVWFVTNAQLLDFMRAPRSAAAFAADMRRPPLCPRRTAFDAAVWAPAPVIDYDDADATSPPFTRAPVHTDTLPTPSTTTAAPTTAVDNTRTSAAAASAHVLTLVAALVVAGLALLQ